MNLYIILYFSCVFLISYLGYSVKKNIKNISGEYYFLFSIFLSIWFTLYFIFYIFSNSLLVTYISKSAFLISIITIYCFLKFIYYFGININKTKYKFIEFSTFILLSYFYIFTDNIISGMSYNYQDLVFYEEYGNFIYFHYIITIGLLIFIIAEFFIKLKNLAYINKIRLKNIFYGFLFFLIFGITFITILPYFGIYLLQKEIILFIIPFIILSWHTLNKYHFSDLVFKYNEIISFFISILFTLLFLFYRYNIGLINFYKQNNLWGISSNFTYIDIIFSITLFFILYKFFINILPLNKEYVYFLKLLNKLKSQIPFLLDLNILNNHLKKFAYDNYNIKHSHINIDIVNKKELLKYFSNSKSEIFINDIVFLEENKNKFNIDLVKSEIPNTIYLVFPMKNNEGNIIGFYELGTKPFKEHYFTEEIKIIKDFVEYLTGHLKYIEIYSKIKYLTINLDKEVDKKTIEYNTLINKQKEFISITSHEIKTPIMSASLQVESLVDDINDGEKNMDYIKKELFLLKNQIFKIADLVKVIFNIEKYDIGNVKLYIEKINIENLFLREIDSLSKINSNLVINFSFDKKVNYIDLDKVQFTQVISNLLHNGSKFSNNEKPVLNIVVKDLGEKLKISIEDNGKGFSNFDKKDIFEKYTTGTGNSIGLGLGLYLCKQIVEFHHGTIVAKNSKILGGAKFEIVIPKEQKRDI